MTDEKIEDLIRKHVPNVAWAKVTVSDDTGVLVNIEFKESRELMNEGQYTH
jgi:hypothetical protein|tara:strand:+ start:324 stop:476 length:153 start_codon:yes stop_codon:yes gene_type:complete